MSKLTPQQLAAYPHVAHMLAALNSDLTLRKPQPIPVTPTMLNKARYLILTGRRHKEQ